MASGPSRVWFPRREEIPAIAELVYSALAYQAVNHVLSEARYSENALRAHCERALRVIFDDASMMISIVKPRESDEIVAFCIEKRCVNDQVTSTSQADSAQLVRRPKPELRTVTGAGEPEPPEYPNVSQARPAQSRQRPKPHPRAVPGAYEPEPPERPNVSRAQPAQLRQRPKPVLRIVTGAGEPEPLERPSVLQAKPTQPGRRPKPELRIITGASGPEPPGHPNLSQRTASHAGPSSYRGEDPALHYRNSLLIEPLSPNGGAMRVYKDAKRHLNLIDENMQGINHIEIEYLWVKPGYREQGIGQRFVDNCMSHAINFGLPLFIRAEPTAAGFFRSCGFRDRMTFILDLAKYAPDRSGYGEYQTVWMCWVPPALRG